MFKNTRLSAVLAAVLFSVSAASALVTAPAFAQDQQPAATDAAPATTDAAAPAADAAAAPAAAPSTNGEG